MTLNILTKQPTELEPYVINDYPYGFRLRTKMMVWKETNKYGERYCTATINPKTGLLNHPKYSNYSDILLIGIETDTGRISYTTLNLAYNSEEKAEEWLKQYREHLNERGQIIASSILATLKVTSKIEYKIVETSGMTSEERKTLDDEQKANTSIINRVIVGNISKDTGLSIKDSIEVLKKL